MLDRHELAALSPHLCQLTTQAHNVLVQLLDVPSLRGVPLLLFVNGRAGATEQLTATDVNRLRVDSMLGYQQKNTWKAVF